MKSISYTESAFKRCLISESAFKRCLIMTCRNYTPAVISVYIWNSDYETLKEAMIKIQRMPQRFSQDDYYLLDNKS